jgi:hypothetical protein
VSWIPLIALPAGLVVAAVILGFCGYELVWKTRRLRRDLRQLQGLGAGLSTLRVQAAAAQQRLARTGVH